MDSIQRIRHVLPHQVRHMLLRGGGRESEGGAKVGRERRKGWRREVAKVCRGSKRACQRDPRIVTLGELGNSEFIPADKVDDPNDLDLWLKVKQHFAESHHEPLSVSNTCKPCWLELTLHHTRMHTQVDGKLRQKGNTKDMIFNVPYLIHYVSSRMSLDYGDIILTGTPEGVGPVSAGQVRHAVQLQ